jgi:putative peptidoglycan lipid II flippase
VLQPAFFARGDTRRPMNYSLISVVVNIALGVSLFFTIGFPGIALATSAASWVTVAQMVVRRWRDDIWRPSARASGKMIRVTVACLALGAILALASHYRPLLETPLDHFHLGPLHAKEVTVLLVCLAGGLLYPALLFAFGGVTPAEARAALKRNRGEVGPVVSGLP